MIITIDCRMIENSGAGTYIQNIVSLLVKKYDNDFYNLIGDTKKISKYIEPSKNVNIIENTSQIYTLKEQLSLLHDIPKNTELMWTPHFNIPLLYRGKILVTIHDMMQFGLPCEYAGGMLKSTIAKILIRIAASRAKYILTVSNFSKNEIIKYLNRPSSSIIVEQLSVDSKWLNIQEGPRPYNRKYCLYVGNVKPHKNLKRLLEAFSLIKDKVDFDLVIVGNKNKLRTADNTIDELCRKMENRVHLTGFVSNEELEQYYKHAEMFIFPSLYEGFGLPILEALAAGCPVISSRSASLPEVGGDAVKYFDAWSVPDMASKILDAYVYYQSNKQNRLISQNQIDKFSWEKATDIVHDVIHRK